MTLGIAPFWVLLLSLFYQQLTGVNQIYHYRFPFGKHRVQRSIVWSYQREGIYAPATGSFRMRENGKKLIGWGTHDPLNITELNTATVTRENWFEI